MIDHQSEELTKFCRGIVKLGKRHFEHVFQLPATKIEKFICLANLFAASSLPVNAVTRNFFCDDRNRTVTSVIDHLTDFRT